MKKIAAALAAILIAGFVTPATARTHHGAIVPTVCVGARANQDGADDVNNVAHNEANFLALQTAIGQPLCIDSEYSRNDQFSTAYPLPQAQWDIANGYVPMLTWFLGSSTLCPLWSDIVAGVYDADYIDKAQVFKSVGGNMIIRMDPAMDSSQRQCFYDVDVIHDPATAGAEFIAMWQHIVSLMRAQGVTNVRWDWSASGRVYNGVPTYMDFYPGSSYVDLVGSQVYNSDPSLVENFQDDVGLNNFYSQASLLGKPLILSETGAAGPDPQQDANGYGCAYSTGLANPSPQQKWLYGISSNLRAIYPAIHFVVWFDTVGPGGPMNCINYIVRGDGLTSMSNMMAKPYFQARTLP